jgi:hypothetical protein
MKRINRHRFTVLIAASISAVFLIALSFFYGVSFLHSNKVEASSQIPITGWLWSDTIGWVSANCSNTSTCGTVNYGLTIDSATGVLSGYAWSDNVGWVSANSSDLAGCPTAPCTASITGNNVFGWLKVVAGGGAQSGGWDGFISLSGSGYGVTYSSGGVFGGFGWGDTNVGWVSFALANSTFNACTPQTVYTCKDPDAGGVYRTVVQTITDASCNPTVVNTACVAPQFCSVGSPTCQTPQPDPFPSGNASGQLTAKPNLVAKNATSTLYWGIVNVTGCTVTGTDGTAWSGAFSATSSCPTKFTSGGSTGCQTQPITQPTTFTLSCTSFDSTPFIEKATVNLLPDFQEQ